MAENHESSNERKERKILREKELKRMVAAEKIRKSKRRKARNKRHFNAWKSNILDVISNIFRNQLFVKKTSYKELEKKEFIKTRIKSKVKQERNLRIKEFLKHPLGKPITEEEKRERLKRKIVKKRQKSKFKKRRWFDFKNNFKESISSISNAEVRIKLFKLIPTSITTFTLAYITIYLITNILTCLIASFWNVNTILSTSVIYYLPSPYSPLWTKGSVVSIYSTQFVSSLVISFFALFLVLRNINKTPVLKSFLMWLVLIAQAVAWGSFFGAFLRQQGLFHAIQWGAYETWFSYKVIEFAMMIFGILWLIIFGYILKPLLVLTTPSATLLKASNRFAFYQFQYAIPAFCAIIIIIIINAPIYNLYLLIQLASVFLILLPLLFDNTSNSENLGKIKITRSKMNIFLLIGLSALIIVCFKLILDIGIPF